MHHPAQYHLSRSFGVRRDYAGHGPAFLSPRAGPRSSSFLNIFEAVHVVMRVLAEADAFSSGSSADLSRLPRRSMAPRHHTFSRRPFVR